MIKPKDFPEEDRKKLKAIADRVRASHGESQKSQEAELDQRDTKLAAIQEILSPNVEIISVSETADFQGVPHGNFIEHFPTGDATITITLKKRL